MEIKWFAIIMVSVFTSMAVSIGIEKYSEGQCKIAYASSNKSAEDIVKLCGR